MHLENLNAKFISSFDNHIKTKIYYKSIDSTQLECWRLSKKKQITSGTMIISDIQTSAIGTHGRRWFTNEKGNIALSMYFKPENLILEEIKDLPIQIAEFLIAQIYRLTGITLEIKYPNDLMWCGKKVGGILVETKVQSGFVNEIVIGIGINVMQKEFPEEIKETATSINNILCECGGM